MENKLSKTGGKTINQRRRTSTGRLHSSTRESLLSEIELRGEVTTSELVDFSRLHENTVRGHLEALYTDGYINRRADTPNGKGRPSYIWMPNNPGSEGLYKELTNTLIDALLSEKETPEQYARTAGKRWGERISERLSPEESAQDTVVEAMRSQGFAPEKSGNKILLHSCPLISAAHKSDIVCAIHEGMIEGIAKAGSGNFSAELKPLISPGVCELRLRSLA